MDDRLAIEFICALALPPDEFVALAGGLGVSRIGLAARPITANPHDYPEWDLLADQALLRRTRGAMAEYGVTVALGEGFLLMPGAAPADFAPALDLMAGLGVPRVNVVSLGADRGEAVENFARFAELAGARGMAATVEFLPLMWPASFAEAVDFVRASGAPNGQVLVDAMHFFRSGSSLEDLAATDPGLIGHIQLCDVPMPARVADYGLEAREERLAPGDGDLPLAAFLAALPRTLTIGLEVPMTARARTGIRPRERLEPVVAAARGLLATLD
ncbi:sugar phosphate isomerase/epimerase family protein [Novosphingobium album (ex Liu et al. 2023)]|uniref:Sugar phosphate isomerase/epimerase n=1 Tax=Novosphingobium album (ex Liu et al. 2023) TaxID=3031130 RepID=A0ABT5WUC1_9SPHN|nr:sugar phosphate isomerase/epimerase [Novosphingobium album (ex Liu et al. 2023)]MDE8653500.1 sugar phosphate isomerase/epimerase [Novosphingobium album (ex Liu et al. 2023)]